jgi:hypothetical protein
MSAQAITLAADIAAGGTLTAESGITFIVPSQSSLSSPETMEIAYMPLHWPAPEPGETPMHVFHLDVAITGSTVPSLPNPAEVVIQMDLTTVPAGHRAWLLEWSSPAGWTLVPEQRYDPLSGVLTVRTDRPGIYGLITAEFPDIRLPSFS